MSKSKNVLSPSVIVEKQRMLSLFSNAKWFWDTMWHVWPDENMLQRYNSDLNDYGNSLTELDDEGKYFDLHRLLQSDLEDSERTSREIKY